MFFHKERSLPSKDSALVGRSQALDVAKEHYVNGHPISGSMPAGIELAVFGLGCFWGAERLFWQLPGVYSTAVAYAGGITPNPNYDEVCSGQTGHTEVVVVYFDREKTDYKALLKAFWEAHDPTQGMRQGNDQGTQYRSAVYTTNEEQLGYANDSAQAFQAVLSNNGLEPITTEIKPLAELYLAETYHQQYLAKNPNGYCSLRGLGLSCPV